MIETTIPVIARPDSLVIANALDQILQSALFRNSAQLQTLLRYLVEVSLSGGDDALKERIIGIEVFGRKPDYDTSNDPIVRSRVGLLRKRLGEYYKSGEAKSANLQIVIPNGSYHPTFIFRSGTSSETHDGLTESQPQLVPFHGSEENPKRKVAPSSSGSAVTFRWRKWGIAAALFCILFVVAWEIVARSRIDDLSLFWGPILESKKTVFLYNGSISPVYIQKGGPGDRTGSLSDLELPAFEPSIQPLATEAPVPNNLVRVDEGLMASGDIAATLKVSNLLSSYHRDLTLRSGGTLPFIDLKGSPAVMIGAYDNYWTLNLAKDLPFYFDRGIDIRERSGQHRVWSNVAGSDSTINDDYAIIFRLVNSKTGGPVIAIAGLSTCGTLAAAEFATDGIQQRKLAKIPRNDLGQKNIELVLHVSLVNCSPTSVDIVGQQVW